MRVKEGFAAAARWAAARIDALAAAPRYRGALSLGVALLLNLAILSFLVIAPRALRVGETIIAPIIFIANSDRESDRDDAEDEEPEPDPELTRLDPDEAAQAESDDENIPVASRTDTDDEDAPEDENPAGGPQVAAPQTPAIQRRTNARQGGVVAIYCPEEFEDADKAAECAGRREIRSGWKPTVDLPEEWSRTIKDLRQNPLKRPDLSVIVGPERAKAMRQEEIANDLRSEQRRLSPVMGGGAEDAWARSGGDATSFAPEEPEPTWTLRDDPYLTERQKRELREGILDKKDDEPWTPDED